MERDTLGHVSTLVFAVIFMSENLILDPRFEKIFMLTAIITIPDEFEFILTNQRWNNLKLVFD